MGYCSSSDVAILVPHMLNGTTDFGASTSPTATAVNSWISTGSAIINTKLASRGYDAIGTSSGAYGVATQINALYAAWWAERSLLSSRVSKMENSRSDLFKKDFYDLLDMLCEMDLSQMGVGRGNRPPDNYAGGIDVTDKTNNEDDTSIVNPRFARGQFQNVETIPPSETPNIRQTRSDPNTA